MWMRITLMVWLAVSVAVTVQSPGLFSDKNTFLKDFVGSDFLSFMGVLVTITLGSAANLFVSLHKLEKAHGKDAFIRTRTDVRDSSYFLIYLLIASFFIVILKSLFIENDIFQCIFNLAAVGCVLMASFSLFDITDAAFTVAPLVGGGGAENDN